MTSMQVSALSNIARLIAEDGGLPPVNVDVYADGRVYLTMHYESALTRMSLARAEEIRDAWAQALGIAVEDPRDDESGVLRYFHAAGMWCGARVYLDTSGALAPVGSVAS